MFLVYTHSSTTLRPTAEQRVLTCFRQRFSEYSICFCFELADTRSGSVFGAL